MAVGFKVSVETKAARRKILRLINLINPRELLQAIGNRHVKWMNQNLRSAGLERPHATMADSTIAARPVRSSSRHFSSRYRSRLAQSFTVRLLGVRAVLAGTQDEFAEIHHSGTRAYTIRPKHSRLLKFKTADGVVYTKEVRHPGIPARPMLPTKLTAERLAQSVLDAALKAKIKQAGA